MYNVKIIADSIANDQRITTVSLTYPRFIHSEFLRHRMLSHSVESSRAVPTEKLIERVANEPFIPETFNKRVKGMGVGDALSIGDAALANNIWVIASKEATNNARALLELDVDKSRVNRLLEPFMFVTDLVTGTDWDNFFALRDHPGAQLEFQKVARMMREEFDRHEPIELQPGEWHLPLVRLEDEFCEASETKQWEYYAWVSAGRCCRWSYGVDPVKAMEEDSNISVDRAERLSDSFHMSPFEHQARPWTGQELYCSQVAAAA
jgi:thymidylate synthase ThyX